ncbi:hypothetical protein [Endozoicomonas sp. 8E]|uniref:hypothetical protein n=1 Tax=Endozoicomonas sp. 8E TaxID=3035692 RepID=UPI0029391059|nr:hypothetical protein [Endozoicomonas sp. 8E]WOG26703.1 hypothetical protein P6910_19445 [Endozoicomonas sp. 8E]
MKNHRASVITRIIFIISILYSYNANASPLNDAISSLDSLIDEIIVKQYQINQKGRPIFSHPILHCNLDLLKLYQATLSAREQPDAVPSKVIYVRKIKKRKLRCTPEASSHHMLQSINESMSRYEGVAHFPFDGSGEACGNLEPVFFSETDDLKDEEIHEKVKDFLSKMYRALENDEVFFTRCSDLGLEKEYKITFDLISVALH